MPCTSSSTAHSCNSQVQNAAGRDTRQQGRTGRNSLGHIPLIALRLPVLNHLLITTSDLVVSYSSSLAQQLLQPTSFQVDGRLKIMLIAVGKQGKPLRACHLQHRT